MADPCPRCGLPVERYSLSADRCAGELPDEPGVIACRDREIALLKGKLLSATRGLRGLALQIDGVLAAAGENLDVNVSLAPGPDVTQGQGETDV